MLLHRAALPILLLGGTLAAAQSVVHQNVRPDRVTPIHTALDHISVIALPEKITRVAAGSQAMQIEWHGNDVFVKPLQSGQSTDLMVWTEHQFSTYELEAPGDVKQMTFVLDETNSPVPQATKSDPPSKKIDQIAASAIGSTLLQVTPVTARGVHPAKDRVSVSIKDVVRDGSFFYVRFAVTNSSPLPYRIEPPNVFEIAPGQSADLLPSMKDEQVAPKTVAQFDANQMAQVSVQRSDIPQNDLSPGQTAQGVVEIKPEDVSKPGIYEFDFGADGGQAVKATAVL
jgi:Conjugal transfer protein